LVPEHTEVTVEIPAHASEDCRAVSSVLARVGDKWSVLILSTLRTRQVGIPSHKLGIDLLVKRSLRRGNVLYMILCPSAEGCDSFPQGTPQRGQLVNGPSRPNDEVDGFRSAARIREAQRFPARCLNVAHLRQSLGKRERRLSTANRPVLVTSRRLQSFRCDARCRSPVQMSA
jgi:hypothetical protein